MAKRVRTTVWMLAAWGFVAAVACSKKEEGVGKGKPVETPAVDASVSPARDVGPSSTEASAPAEATLVADAGSTAEATSAAPPPPVGGGAALLAQLMGGGMPRLGAAPAEPVADTSGVLRESGKRALDQEEVPVLERATDAARIASALPPSTPTSWSAGGAPSAPLPPGDPCDRLMPRVADCLATTLGEALSAEDLQEATRECSTTYSGMPAATQDSLRQCAAAPDCGSLLQCLTPLSSGGEADSDQTDPPPPPVGEGTLCARIVRRTAQCTGVQISPHDHAAAVEECTGAYEAAGPAAQREAESCVLQPCDSFFECLGEVNPARSDSTGSTGGELDPARVASLPPATRAECTAFADGFVRCMPALAGVDTAQAPDPSVEAAMLAAAESVKPELERTCLQMALDSPEMMPVFRQWSACTRGPCAQLIECFQTAASAAVP